jgi:hypothetical protein
MHKLGKTLRKFVKHKKPEICMVVGTGLGLAAIISACYQTNKGGSKLIEDHKARLRKAKAMSDDDPKKKKAVTLAYGKTLVEGARLLAGPTALFVASVTSFWMAHHTMKVRNAGLAAVATGLRKELKDYRGRVKGQIGEEAEERLYYGTQSKEIEETVIDENGEEKLVKVKSDDVIDELERSDYVKYLAKGNRLWDRSPEMTEFRLNCQQNLANEILKQKGEITLNEVYDMLDFERTEAGMVIGWIYDKHHPFGENKVEFKIKRVHIPNENGVGYSLGYAIDFNVDGNIYQEKIRRRGLKSFRKR